MTFQRILTIALLLVSGVLCGHAEATLPPKCEAFLPRAFLKSVISLAEATEIETSSAHGQNVPPVSPKFWVAYSDRCDNVTYNGPDESQGVFGRLDFNEKVRIAKVSGDFALVYTEPQEGIDYPKISSSAQSRGWVPVSHLLLWRRCPVNSSGVMVKAVASTCLLQGMVAEAPFASALGCYYVMKRQGDQVLLSLTPTYEDLIGWAPARHVQLWDDRLCLEPNWDPGVVQSFVASGVAIPMYADQSLSVRRFELPFGNKNHEDDNPATCYRMRRNVMRYPLLYGQGADSSAIRCVASHGVPSAQAPQRALSDWATSAKHVNIILVISGSVAMEKYLPIIRYTVAQGFDCFPSDWQARVGAVIYRDYQAGQGMTEAMPVTRTDDAALADFLERGGRYGLAGGASTAALFSGLNVALDHEAMGYDSRHSNLVVVIGDRGDDESDARCPGESHVLMRLQACNAQLMSIQVGQMDTPAGVSFDSQMNSLIKENIRQHYSALGRLNMTVKFCRVDGGYDLQSEAGTLPYTCSTRFPDQGLELEPGLITAHLNAYAQSFCQAVQSQAQALGTALVARSPEGSSAVARGLLRRVLGNDTSVELDRSLDMSNYVCHTSTRATGGTPYWKPVVYISTDELSTLISQLQGVGAAAQQGDRNAFVEAMKALAQAMLPDIPVAEVYAMGVHDVLAMCEGVGNGSWRDRGPTLQQVLDVKTLDDNEFHGMTARIQQKYNGLKKIKSDKNYKYLLMINNTKHYWIPVEDLP